MFDINCLFPSRQPFREGLRHRGSRFTLGNLDKCEAEVTGSTWARWSEWPSSSTSKLVDHLMEMIPPIGPGWQRARLAPKIASDNTSVLHWWWFQIFLIVIPIWVRFPWWLIFSDGLKPPTSITFVCLKDGMFWSPLADVIAQGYSQLDFRHPEKSSAMWLWSWASWIPLTYLVDFSCSCYQFLCQLTVNAHIHIIYIHMYVYYVSSTFKYLMFSSPYFLYFVLSLR